MPAASPPADLEIHILKREESGYPVEFTLNQRLEFRRGALSAEVLSWQSDQLGPAAGSKLFEMLVADAHVRDAWAEVRGRYPQRRLRLVIDAEAPELHAIPWELLAEPGNGGITIQLAAADATPFSRYLRGATEPGTAVRARPLKILVAIAAPAIPAKLREAPYHLEPIDVDAEWRSLQAAVAGLPVKLIPVSQPCTLEAVNAGLLAGAHVLHFIGHGTYSPEHQVAAILMADRHNQVRYVFDQEHAAMLARYLHDGPQDSADRLRLVFLDSCQTATRSPADAFRGFAPQVVEAGVPAVIAMQDLVPVPTARAFTAVFYRQLLRHGQVDLASNQARAALLSGDYGGAHIPVLFMRLPEGQLLAPSPVRQALEQIRDSEQYGWYAPEQKRYLPLPVEVVHLTGSQEYRSLADWDAESTATLDFLQAITGILQVPLSQGDSGRPIPRLVVVMGEYGCNKSTQLERLVWETARTSLQPLNERPVLPIYVNFEVNTLAADPGSTALAKLALANLQPFWPNLDQGTFDEMLQGDETTLRVIFDNLDTLTERQRQDARRQIQQFVAEYPQHQVVLATSPEAFDRAPFSGQDLHILLLQRLERRKIRHFLRSLPADDPAGQPLLETLDHSGLFDLAGVPFFMLNLVRAARAGQYPRSRTQVVQRMVDQATDRAVRQMIGDMDARTLSPQGMRDHLEQLLLKLAWRMQSQLTATLPLAGAFALMQEIRGDREYSLEDLYRALVDQGLLAAVGTDSLRFAYSRFQAYCCAAAVVQHSDRDRILENIAATLGRLTRLRWWEETLIFACGLMAEDVAGLEHFLGVIVYGINLLESEQTFLAARCLLETTPEDPAPRGIWNVSETVTSALVWKLSNRNEPQSAQRSRAALLLGQVAQPLAVEQLARAAYKKTRLDRRGRVDFDYSNVRMAAIVGLLRMTSGMRVEMLKSIDKDLVTLLHLWQGADVPGLIEWLKRDSKPQAQGVAALALGDLRMQLVLNDTGAEAAELALNALAEAFFSPQLDQAARWAVTYGLAIIDLPAVKRVVIDPFCQHDAELAETQEERILYYKCMAYLIGLVRWSDQAAYDFLLQRSMAGFADANLAGAAMDALARLADRRYKGALERIALGEPSQYLPHFDLSRKRSRDAIYLRRKAIEALAVLGDEDTVITLRAGRSRQADWHPDLESALYRTSEEIFWRRNWSLPT